MVAAMNAARSASAGAAVPVERSRRRPSAGIVYVALSTVIAVVLAAVAVTAAQSPPPAIAELAPAAVQQITDAPTEQSSQLGSADGGGGGAGDETPSTTTTVVAGGADGVGPERPRIERARVNRCVGNPPRQIEDPQSPPCVPFWEGDNGGATYAGVTRDEIRVVVPDLPGARERLQAFFNNRFEFYGRRLVLQQIVTGTPCEAVKAGAERVQNEVKAFGSLSLWKSDSCYLADLARRKLVGVTSDVTYTTAELKQLAPYVWAYPDTLDDVLASTGQWICARLAGRPARAADGVDTRGTPMAGKRRKFGVIIQTDAAGRRFDTASLDRELAKCGETIGSDARFLAPEATMDTATSTNVALQFNTAGVTTVLCLCGSFQNLYLPSAASSQRYFPEWIASSYLHSDNTIFVKTFWPDAQQRSNVLGISHQPRQWTFDDTPMIWAQKEADPTFNPTEQSGAVNFGQWSRFYRMLLVMASGIQMAGPKLTPETFARGLQAAGFPNPATPLVAGRAGFQTGDASMTDDANEFWWSETDRSPYGDATGTICYVDGGARRSAGTWPAGDDPFFRGPCDSGSQRAG